MYLILLKREEVLGCNKEQNKHLFVQNKETNFGGTDSGSNLKRTKENQIYKGKNTSEILPCK